MEWSGGQEQAVWQWLALVVVTATGGVVAGLAQQRWWGPSDRRR